MKRTLVARLPDWDDGSTDSADFDRAAEFEPILAALDELTPHVEVLEPGVVAIPLRPLSGDEQDFCERLIDTVAGLCGMDCLTGVADGLFAALLAARDGRIVAPGGDAAFLAPFDIADLQVTRLVADETCETLRHLGIDTIGAFTLLPGPAVAERFGPAARQAQLLASGKLARPLVPRRPDPDVAVDVTPEEPYETVEQALFAARPLAERLLAVLHDRDLACTRVTVTAHTARGLARERTWQLDPAAGADDLARRIRWQLEGWLSDGGTDAVVRLGLAPGGLLDLIDAGRSLWETKDATEIRAEAALRHTQSLLGPEAVRIAVPTGGRDLPERLSTTEWDTPPPRGGAPETGPWPGALPDPLPALVGTDEQILVLGADGRPVTVSVRGALSTTPAWISLDGKRIPILAWAGPWPVHERWWEPEASRRYARLQVELPGGRAALLAVEDRQWKAVGWYD